MPETAVWTCSECAAKMKADSEIVIEHWRREHPHALMEHLTLEVK